LITYLRYPKPTTLHHRQRIAVAFLQAQRKTLPWKLLCWVTKRITTAQAVTRYCSSRGIPHRIVRLDPLPHNESGSRNGSGSGSVTIPPAVLHVLTPPGSSRDGGGRALIYFHGGGYVNPLRGGAHMPFILGCARAAGVQKVVVVEYSLAPEFPYPAQLVQCIEAVRYVMSEMKVKAEDIILGGDSAGGQLVGGVLAHVVRSCGWCLPLELKNKDERFGSAVMVSPFVRVPLPKTSNGKTSYEVNEGRDYLSREQVDQFKVEFGANERDLYANLCVEEEIWGEIFGPDGGRGVVDKVLVTVGTGEVFLDCCRFFAERCLKGEVVEVKRGMSAAEIKGLFTVEGNKSEYVLVECEGETHVQPALDAVVGYEDGLMNGAIMAWLERHFAGS
ncbi:Alpha/Beta hydrolase protein, partial [Cladorrhinum sp. PSN332]